MKPDKGVQRGEYFSGSAIVTEHMKFKDDFNWDTVLMGTCENCGKDLAIPSNEKVEVKCSCGWVLNFQKYIDAYESGKKYEGMK